MYLQKDKVETLLAKEVLTCGFHRMPRNQLCRKNYTLFGPAIFNPPLPPPKKKPSESLISSGSGTYTDALVARHTTSESFIHFRVLAFFYLLNECQSMILAFFF